MKNHIISTTKNMLHLKKKWSQNANLGNGILFEGVNEFLIIHLPKWNHFSLPCRLINANNIVVLLWWVRKNISDNIGTLLLKWFFHNNRLQKGGWLSMAGALVIDSTLASICMSRKDYMAFLFTRKGIHMITQPFQGLL